MNNLNWFNLVVVSIAGLVVGCSGSSSSDEGQATTVNALGMAPLEGAVEVRLERQPDGTFAPVGDVNAQAIGPNVWDVELAGGVHQRIVMGEEGHRWLSEQPESALLGIDSPAAAALIEQPEFTTEATLAANCNWVALLGKACPNGSCDGATAQAQIVCQGGCQTFTVLSQACCGASCTPLDRHSQLVCSTPWTAGSTYYGTGAGYARVTVTPPGTTQTKSNFTCD